MDLDIPQKKINSFAKELHNLHKDKLENLNYFLLRQHLLLQFAKDRLHNPNNTCTNNMPKHHCLYMFLKNKHQNPFK